MVNFGFQLVLHKSLTHTIDMIFGRIYQSIIRLACRTEIDPNSCHILFIAVQIENFNAFYQSDRIPIHV